jgi:DNA-binding phage protein
VQRSWTQVAEELGLTREALYRAVATLECEKKLSRGSGLVKLAPFMRA